MNLAKVSALVKWRGRLKKKGVVVGDGDEGTEEIDGDSSDADSVKERSGIGHASTRAEDAEEAEAISVIHGMRAARSVGLEKVVVLTDCRRLVRAYELYSNDLSWEALTLAPDMLGLASCFSDFRFCHISRSLNFEAHALVARGPLFPAVSIFEPLEANLFVNDVTCSLLEVGDTRPVKPAKFAPIFSSIVPGMDEVQLYTIIHFGGDIVRPKIGLIVSYVGGSTKFIVLRAHSSYEDFVTVLEETSEIRREDCLSTTKDTGSGKGLPTTKAGGPLRHNSFPLHEPEYWGYPETNGRRLNPRRFGPLVDNDDVPQSNDSFKTIHTNVLPSNELSIPQSNVHHSNEPMLTNAPQSNNFFQTISTNVPLSNEPKLTNVHLSIKPEPIIGQTEPSGKFAEFIICVFEPQPEQVKDLVDFQFKSAAYTEDPYDFSKEFNISDLNRDRFELKNHIRAYVVINKFNLEHVLSNEYKIVMRGSFEYAYQILMSYFAEVRYGVTYTNHVESWNNIILKVRDLHIHVFIEELRRIYSRMSYTYWKEAEKSQARLTPWASNHCSFSLRFSIMVTSRRPTTSVQIEVSLEPGQLTELRANLDAKIEKRAELELQLTKDRELREKELDAERQARLRALKRHEDQLIIMQTAFEALQNT
ncbi:hypothetical protein GIB67_007645 [Kingdonia uniflora]|uniref:RNase H type-1 domain-containing protein n=1 Tax=Kingdonia uniflora TaxID=39325 RepID=A0A7J7N1S7_9MAGN|nr:hypothetical protein GIB67_007645 [Kingdonia uniflora]